MKNIAIIDLESQSASTSYGSIISIAGILVNSELEEIYRFELNCRNKPGHVPDPYSLWVNKGFDQMKNSNLSHYQLMQEFHKIIKKWSPCIWIGWNSVGFDFVMIQKENYKSLLPAYALNTNSNEQADFLPVARASKLFFPDSINTTLSEKKNPIFKLEKLSIINDIKVKQFHTAISDCEACLGIMKIIKKEAGDIYDESFNTTSKHKVANILEKERVFTTAFYYYGKARPFVVTHLCNHAEYKWPMVFCLEHDPDQFFKLNINDLKEELKKPGKWARALPANKHPIILKKEQGLKLDIYKKIGLNKIKERAEKINQNNQFSEKVSFALGEIARDKRKFKEKKILAFEVTKITRGEAQADEAKEISTNIFAHNTLDDRINSFSVESKKILESSFSIIDAIEKLKLVNSRSEIKRLIKSNGIKVNNKNYNESDLSLSKYVAEKEIKISVGKKKIGKIIIIS